ISIYYKVGNASRKFSDESVAQFREALRLRIALARNYLERRRKTGGKRDTFRSSPYSLFLRAAHDDRCYPSGKHATPDIQCADTMRAVQFVRAKREQVDSDTINDCRKIERRLTRVSMERHHHTLLFLVRAQYLSYFSERLYRTYFIVRPADGNEYGFFTKQARYGIRRYDAARIRVCMRYRAAHALYFRKTFKYRIVFNGAHYPVGAFQSFPRQQALACESQDGEIHALCESGSEYKFARLHTQTQRDALSRIL